MDLFQRLIMGGEDEIPPPLVGELRNELGKTQTITLYSYDQNRPFNYGFLDVRNATFPDGTPNISGKGFELYLSGVYQDTFYMNPNGDMWLHKQVFLGTTTYTVRVFDEFGQFSQMSNPISYFVRPYNTLTDTNYVEDVNFGPGGMDVHLEIWKWLDTVYLNNINLLELYIDFELIVPSGTVLDPSARFTAEIHGNKNIPTLLTFDNTDNWGGPTPKRTLVMGKANPNEYDKWRISGILGIKLRKENNPPGAQLKITWRMKDANNLESTWNYFF